VDAADLRIELTQETYPAGGELAGAFVVAGGLPDYARKVVLTVLWRTAGKGTVDVGVAHVREWSVRDNSLAGLANPHTFTVPLPRTPLTYDGQIVRIHWAAKVEVLWAADGAAAAEAAFVLAPAGR
jgi:hypothetical protein